MLEKKLLDIQQNMLNKRDTLFFIFINTNNS
jgi:hypothetical protein